MLEIENLISQNILKAVLIQQNPKKEELIEQKFAKEKNFTILKSTLCPAVLTENFFMDNKADVKYLLSPEGHEAVINCHVEGIINYIKSL